MPTEDRTELVDRRGIGMSPTTSTPKMRTTMTVIESFVSGSDGTLPGG